MNDKNDFSEAVRRLFWEKKGVDVDTLDYREDLPDEREKYNLYRVTGNVNLVAGRFMTPAEAKAKVERFVSMKLP